MEEVLKLCIALDRSAQKTLARMSAVCPNADLKAVFRQMSAEEATHVSWWTRLLEEWNAGLIPMFADEDKMLAQLKEVASELAIAVPKDIKDLSTDEMLEIALRMEFFMLDPLFAELLDTLDPGTATHQDQYAQHVIRLTDAIQKHYTRKEMAPVLAAILSRTFRAQRRLATLAVRDPLTGLFNRRGFYGYLQQWTTWSERYQRPIAVLVADVDEFKRINDTLGHPAGDDALKGIADTLLSAVRRADIVGRYGGDEFSILAPEADTTELTALMDRAVAAIRSRAEKNGGPLSCCTISIGGAYMDGKVPVSPERLLAAADHSLYEAKNAGKDRAGVPIDAKGF
ncbi:MAG: diguanylate cyclase [Coriobacteriia bacterium]